jgi:hypothetical protein
MRYLAFLLPLALLPLQAATLTFTNTSNAGLTFNYTASVQNNQEIQSGNYFIIFDFAGLVSGTGPNADWSFSSVSDVAAQPDNPSIMDAIFTYTGSTPIVGVPGGTQIGTFSLTSTFTAQTQGLFFSQATRSSGGNAGEPVIESASLLAVASDPSAANPVPEPSAMVLAGGGLLALTFVRAARRAKAGVSVAHSAPAGTGMVTEVR